MSRGTTGTSRKAKEGIQWWAVFLGWIVALWAGLILGPLLRVAFGLFAGPPVEGAELTAAVMASSLLSGFLAYVLGGYIAAKLAHVSEALHGAMTAVVGLVVGAVLAGILGVVEISLAEGVAVPPVSFGLAGGALLTALLLFLVNLLGGYLGGKWGQPSSP